MGFMLTPIALGFVASALYFSGAGGDPVYDAIDRQGERRSVISSTFGTSSSLHNPANLCAAGTSCSKIERHEKRYARRIISQSSTSKTSTYGSGQYVGLRRR